MSDGTIVPAQLTVCVVAYRPDREELAKTLTSLSAAIANAVDLDVSVTIVDNSPSPDLSSWLNENFAPLRSTLIEGHGNIGFGRANNLVLPHTGDFHLVLNPDVVMAADALGNAVRFMQANPNCLLLTPLARSDDGERHYLCKRFPSLLDLALRGFAPRFIRDRFRSRLDRYEMRDVQQHGVYWNPPIVGGCFMFFRGETFRKLGGFDDRYFLYFEDFDLSLRVRSEGEIAYDPNVAIVHGGGNASRKGIWHIHQFCKSAFSFYRRWGFSFF